MASPRVILHGWGRILKERYGKSNIIDLAPAPDVHSGGNRLQPFHFSLFRHADEVSNLCARRIALFMV